MSKSIKFLLSMTVAGLMLSSSLAGAVDRPNNKKVDKNDPVIKCQMECQSRKTNESYEECMLKCKKTHKSKHSMTPESKSNKK